jgi:citrate lyase subunit beta / citryl-CoA lyase
LIHPQQISQANEVFAPSNEEIEEAQKILQACGIAPDEIQVEAGGVRLVNGKLVESLHILEAQRIIRLRKAIEEM